jgi:Restriction endonuclease
MPADQIAQAGPFGEELVAELFRRLGYDVLQNVRVAGIEVDLIVQRDGSCSPVEIFLTKKLRLDNLHYKSVKLHALQRSRKDFVTPIIVIFSEASTEAKHWLERQFSIQIWDLGVLREKTRPHKDLHQKLMTIVGTKAEHQEAEATTQQKVRKDRDEAAELIRKLESHEENGHLSPSDYERLCMTVFIFLFDPYLYGFEAQTETTDGGNRYDFVCRIKNGNDFWNSVRTDFRTRSIIFECKNYQQPITADQVYSTERYLFVGALRTVCFLVSRKGADEGAYRAAQGALRESGKLVLLLSNRDLVEMLRLKAEEDGPTS